VSERLEQADPPDDDPSIPGDEVLYRRLSFDGGAWVTKDPVTGEPVRPSSGGFDPDADGVSVFRRTLLLQHDPPLGPGDVALRPGDILASFTVADVRALQLGVRDDLWPKDVPDPDHARYAAHALITGLDSLGRNPRTRLQRRLATASSMQLVYT
jgi:hypothetical protein